MTIVSIKTGIDGELQKVGLSNGSFFSFKACYLPPTSFDKNRLQIGFDLTEQEEEALHFASACLWAEKVALGLLTRAEQSAFGLKRKLEKRGHALACAKAVIAQLQEAGLLDDCRYAKLWLESKMSRQISSPWRLTAALHNRGIDRNDTNSALKAVLDDDGEFQLLQRFAGKLQRRTTEKNSLKYLLRNEGFSSKAIQRFFDE